MRLVSMRFRSNGQCVRNTSGYKREENTNKHGMDATFSAVFGVHAPFLPAFGGAQPAANIISALATVAPSTLETASTMAMAPMLLVTVTVVIS